MIGPAGFMRAPNTHEGRPKERGPLEPWETITLGDIWSSTVKQHILKVTEAPHSKHHPVVCLNLETKRHNTVDTRRFLRDYRKVIA
jgi:hypothetical protein